MISLLKTAQYTRLTRRPRLRRGAAEGETAGRRGDDAGRALDVPIAAIEPQVVEQLVRPVDIVEAAQIIGRGPVPFGDAGARGWLAQVLLLLNAADAHVKR